MNNKLREIKNCIDYLKKGVERFMVSQVGVLIRDDKCLILNFSGTEKWGLPGGRIDKMENGNEALLREFDEELGFKDIKVLGIVDYSIFYWGNNKNPVCAVANLIENYDEKIILSDEHQKYEWVELNKLKDYDFIWSKEVIYSMVKRGFELKELLKNNEK